MANPDTDLLRGHRWKGIAKAAAALAGIGAIGVVLFLVFSRTEHDPKPDEPLSHAVTPAHDAGVATGSDTTPKPSPPDAPGSMSHDDITALSRFGFFSIAASKKTLVYVDGRLIGEAPLQRMPLMPGPHTIKAVGPRGKKKEVQITIYGGQDTDEGVITW